MRLVIIVTFPLREYELWAISKKWPADESLAEIEVRVGEVGNDRVAVLCQAQSNKGTDSERKLEIRNTTTPWVVQIANSEPFAAADVYLAAHQGLVHFENVKSATLNGRFRAGAAFSHISGDRHSPKLFDTLRDLIDKEDVAAFEKTVSAIVQAEALAKTQARKPLKDRFSDLKHGVTRVFLPIVVDLRAWRDSGFDELSVGELADFYFDDESRLDLARTLIYKQGQNSERETMEDIVNEAQLQNEPSWQSITALLPRSEPDANDIGADASYAEASKALSSMKDKKTLKELRNVLLVGDPFGAWLSELDTKMSILQDRLGEMDAG